MDSTETTSIGTVPASVSSNETSTSGINVGALLQQIQGDTATQQKLMREAISPVSGAHTGQIPSSMTQPIGEAPQTPNQGRPQNKGQAIGDMIRSAGNAVSKVITAEKQQKQTKLTDATTKLMQHQSMIDEATQQKESAEAMMKNATGAEYEDYKATADKADAAIKSNTENRDKIIAEPKLRKDLTKIFSLNHVDIEQNDPQHVKALQDSLKNIQGWKAKREAVKADQQKRNQEAPGRFGTAFAASQPQTPGAPNKIAQQQLEAYQQQRKDAIDTFKAMGPIYAEQLRAKGAVTVEGMRSATDLRKAAIDSAAIIDAQILKNKQASLDNEAARSLEGLRNANARSLELLKQGNSIEVLKSFNDAQKNYETSITENQKSRQALNDELDKASSSRGTEIRRQLQNIDASDEQAKNAFTLNRNVIAKGLNVSVDDPRLQIPTVHVGEGAQNGAGAAGTSAKPVSTDNDPRTGKPWKSSISATDKLLVKGYYGAGIVSHSAKQTVESVNSDFNKLKKWATTDQDPDGGKRD
jgi:hypothetical protein